VRALPLPPPRPAHRLCVGTARPSARSRWPSRRGRRGPAGSPEPTHSTPRQPAPPGQARAGHRRAPPRGRRCC
jgi:hypothetical protein